jgi:urease accessory protein UreE
MSDFNYQEYLRNNPLLKEEVKDQLITEGLNEDIYDDIVAADDDIPADQKKAAASAYRKVDKGASAEKALKNVKEEEVTEEASSKMKVSELKAKIKEDILSVLSEAEEEVDVDVDVEDEVEVDAEADDIEIERPGVKTTVNVGLSPEEEIVQDSLKAAMDAANELGNQKLADQIGNTITFFTREFVVGQNTD